MGVRLRLLGGQDLRGRMSSRLGNVVVGRGLVLLRGMLLLLILLLVLLLVLVLLLLLIMLLGLLLLTRRAGVVLVLRGTRCGRRGGASGRSGLLDGGSDIEDRVDDSGDGLNLGAQFGLDAVEILTVLVREEGDGKTKMTEATGTTNAMEVRLGSAGEIEVDDNIDGLDIDTTGEQI